MRYGYLDDAGAFRYPEDGATGLFKLAIAGHVRPDHPDAAVFEPRQTPTLLGLGALDAISPEAILERADPTDLDGDGISGVAHILADGRLGRFGWKAQLPDVREFVADALANELHLTLDPALDLGFARLTDDDDAPDPELSDADFDALAFFVGQLAPPAPRAAAGEGRVVFERIGCDRCHVPRLTGLPTAAPDAYTDLLLHAIGPPDRLGIADGDATPAEFRTPPLWGLSSTAPYLHDGSATTLAAAIEAHGGEAEAVRMDYEALGPSEKAALLAFLEGL
ncbi:MAG: hypothetical protein H6703_14180 [Myxococcales bacterium]|nr:hypothetical protein [Myxococcales bacterium]